MCHCVWFVMSDNTMISVICACLQRLVFFVMRFLIINFLTGLALMELSKDKPSVRQVENHSTNYMKALDAIENGLSTHINYLTQCSTGKQNTIV